MNHLIIFFFIGYAQALDCVLVGNTCTFHDVKVTKENPFLNATAENITAVEIIAFNSSIIPILTDEFCKTFPNVHTLELYELEMEEVHPNALRECRNLTQALFYGNKLTTLDINLFNRNPEIRKISIQANNFTTIDPEIFLPVTKLNHLVLAENFFTEIPLELFPVIPSLERFQIYVNDLTDLDEQELMYKFPNLKEIIMHNNLFDCARLRIILNAIKRKGIKNNEFFKHAFPRNLDAETVIDNVECLTEEFRFRKFVKTQEVIEEKIFYLIVGCGVLGLLVILVPVICCLLLKCQKKPLQGDYDAYYYSQYYLPPAK